jgi:hypothetical protein
LGKSVKHESIKPDRPKLPAFKKTRLHDIILCTASKNEMQVKRALSSYLGPAKDLLNYEGNRPISMTWELEYPIPAELFEAARSV